MAETTEFLICAELNQIRLDVLCVTKKNIQKQQKSKLKLNNNNNNKNKKKGNKL